MPLYGGIDLHANNRVGVLLGEDDTGKNYYQYRSKTRCADKRRIVK
jgi:hypothetical protein